MFGVGFSSRVRDWRSGGQAGVDLKLGLDVGGCLYCQLNSAQSPFVEVESLDVGEVEVGDALVWIWSRVRA